MIRIFTRPDSNLRNAFYSLIFLTLYESEEVMYKVIYLYILECSDESYYIGVTNNAYKRIMEHNEGINKDAYTYSRRPVKMVWSEMFTDFNLAFEWETKIKKWSRAKKQALIKGDFNLLKQLAKKKFPKKNESDV